MSRKKKFKKTWKKFEKPLDKQDRMWYNKKVAEIERVEKKKFKKLEKSLKNLLTNEIECDIIYRLSARQRVKQKIAHWKLNNNKCTKKDSENSFEFKCLLSKQLFIVNEHNKITLMSWYQLRVKPDWIYYFQRVWSWLRMNAGGVHNTFKSNGDAPSGADQWRTGE